MRLPMGPVLAIALAAAPAAGQEPLARARAHYNQERFDEAIRAAEEAALTPGLAGPAAVVKARAHLERFRQTLSEAELSAALQTLRSVDPRSLPERDRIEFTIGLGEWLFLDDRFGAAAELFEATLTQAAVLGPRARERALDWWATAMDRHAQINLTNRTEFYRRVVQRMEKEVEADPGSTAAGYWLPAAARGAGDLDRAWAAAVAGWLRATLAPDRGAQLRADLDRLVRTAIIPERAREVARGRDAAPAANSMTAEWERLKRAWP